MRMDNSKNREREIQSGEVVDTLKRVINRVINCRYDDQGKVNGHLGRVLVFVRIVISSFLVQN